MPIMSARNGHPLLLVDAQSALRCIGDLKDFLGHEHRADRSLVRIAACRTLETNDVHTKREKTDLDDPVVGRQFERADTIDMGILLAGFLR